MARDKHVDGQLLRLFLSSGVYRQYAELFLRPEQIDELDVAYWASSPGSAFSARARFSRAMAATPVTSRA
ncbi:hypothetical protein WR25_04876 [Diploscapter pachys]|uniref:Uncharacterized protein n=1 Tax=Diploscapter pachys TaxID=2018661 RepID=A0A2A2K860_9BILA|nr:hypothetical protein WR25_04876 [Diploscapter pachys]